MPYVRFNVEQVSLGMETQFQKCDWAQGGTPLNRDSLALVGVMPQDHEGLRGKWVFCALVFSHFAPRARLGSRAVPLSDVV